MMNSLKCLLITIWGLFLTACQEPITQVDPDKLGKIWDLRHHKVLTPSDFIRLLASQDRLLIGEHHDSVKQHQAEHWLLEKLNQKRPQGSLLLEMLSVDQQPLIEPARKRLLSLDDLPQALNWQPAWSWALYGEIVQHALKNAYPLVATNLTKMEIQTLMQGAIPLNGRTSTATAVKKQLADLIVASHGDELRQMPDALTKMVEVQQFRDRRMAEKLLAARTPSLLIAGNHHVNRQYGVPLHLRELAPHIAVSVVMLVSDEKQLDVQNADYLWVIPN